MHTYGVSITPTQNPHLNPAQALRTRLAAQWNLCAPTPNPESFIDVDLRFTPGNASTKALLAPLKKTVLWLVHNQVTLNPV